ncbi:MAG TPA: DUF2017 domain-containing protein [Actinomycetes bacterium]|nr:DUF2017 domain-containing protein [Actinomycetes bacterium]
MSTAFRRARDGSIRASFEAVEAGVLTNLITQLAGLLQDERGEAGFDGLPVVGPRIRSGLADDLPAEPDNGSVDGPDDGSADGPDKGTADELADDLAASIGLPTEPVRAPTDPVLARLLPDGYTDDPEAAAEFRRYTEYDLRMGKLSAAAIVLDTLESGGSIRLDEAQAHEWMRVLNDLRLAIGTRLDVDEDYEATADALPADDPLRGLYAVYEWLTWMQDSLVSALSKGR